MRWKISLPLRFRRPYVCRTHERNLKRAKHTPHRRFSSSIGSHFFYITYLLIQKYLSVLKLQQPLLSLTEVDAAPASAISTIGHTSLGCFHHNTCCSKSIPRMNGNEYSNNQWKLQINGGSTEHKQTPESLHKSCFPPSGWFVDSTSVPAPKVSSLSWQIA